MPQAFIFADEAGDFKFAFGPNISRYFIICTMRVTSCEIGADLHDLRRRMLVRGIELGPKFHAATDPPPIRNEVYNLIDKYQFRVDATILEKSKARPYTRPDEATFYQYAWFYHGKYIIPHTINQGHNLLVTAAALETKNGKAAFKNAFNNVMQQVTSGPTIATDFPLSASEPCLQAADYCAWAIQRKWERNDLTRLNQLGDRVATQFDLWRWGNTHYYHE